MTVPVQSMQVDPRRNGLNAVRLTLATSVVLWHSFKLTGNEVAYPQGGAILGSLGVDGFFVISGLLLTGSLLHGPGLRTFLVNRMLRIFPGFWVCLVVTGLVFGPVSLLMSGTPLDGLVRGSDPAWRYVLVNATSKIFQATVGGSPGAGVVERDWNGSLWTLSWEVTAYCCLAVLGLAGILRRRRAVLGGALSLWALHIADSISLIPENYWISLGSRLGFMFTLGVLLHLYGPHITSSRRLTIVATMVVVASSLLPVYSVVGGPAWAYLVVQCGKALVAPQLGLRSLDLSYGLYIYSFPVQQLMILSGVASVGVSAFFVLSLVATLPLAYASWTLVEQPALRWKNRRGSRVDPVQR